jgi:cyclic dehypoxanthinyl futalosine synthase
LKNRIISYGFITFIPWAFQDEGTVLRKKHGIKSTYNGIDYIRMIAISRIMLNNIRNIQASILTVGKEIGMLSLHAGANDLGSIMIEENVVSAAGSKNRFNADEMQSIIKEAGFVPARRNQKYELFNTPTPPPSALQLPFIHIYFNKFLLREGDPSLFLQLP